MADDSFDSLRLSLMQDVLPVGLAIVERARRGGAAKLVEVLTTSKDPLKDLRVEGESAAQTVRERLDQVSPGLGNPVIPVTVDVDDSDFVTQEIEDGETLVNALTRIEDRLRLLEQHFQSDVSDRSSSLEEKG